MGQAANSHRNASLNESKEHSAGRHGRTGQHAPGQEQISDDATADAADLPTGGAFGKDGTANHGGGVGTQGGGGGESSPAKDSHITTGTGHRK